jgi:hypothetical protein
MPQPFSMGRLAKAVNLHKDFCGEFMVEIG